MTRVFALIALALVIALPAAAADREILLRHSFHQARERVREQKPVRARFIEPDFGVLAGKESRKLTVALFDDIVLHVQLEVAEQNPVGATVWTGTIEGEANSSVILSVKGGAMSGLFTTQTRRYAIEPGENGSHEALELDALAFPDESEPFRPFRRGGRTAASNAVVAHDTAQYFDVLVVYTDDLRSYLGGTAAAQTAASNAVAAMNAAYANSGVTPRVRLVGTSEVSYVENGDLTTALYSLRNNGDGVLDQVHSLRDQSGADAVSMLLLSGGGSCGVGFLMTDPPSPGFASNAFNVVVNSCATGNLSFAHELGHNFGLEHDRYVSPSGNPAYSYGFGYVDTAGQFRDVMAYSNACGGCQRIQYFSNPDITYLGRPLGVSYQLSNSADNVRALNNAASVVANWRQSVQTPPPPVFTDDPINPQSTTVKLVHVTELRTAINNYRAQASLGATTWTSISAGTTITAAHILELRQALTPALTALGQTATYTDASLSGVAIKAVHLQELREYLK